MGRRATAWFNWLDEELRRFAAELGAQYRSVEDAPTPSDDPEPDGENGDGGER